MLNSKHTAPDSGSTAASILSFDNTTSFAHVQNTDAAVTLRVGFVEANLLTDGLRVLAGETYIVPLKGIGKLYVVSEGVVLTNLVILIRG